MNILKTTTYNWVEKKGGFSLIELLVAMAIMSVVSVAIYGVFSAFNQYIPKYGIVL